VFILGMMIDWIGILLIVTPIAMPIFETLGFDPLWAGMLIIVTLQSSFLTPPFATSLFYLKGVVPEGVPTGDIYKGAYMFVALQFAAVILCIIFPPIITWLPSIL
jgi:TRAP-type mannitol/chloroaromatic compound transport system permease large subunit